MATNIRRDGKWASGTGVAANRPDNARKAIIIGCASTIVLGVLYLGRDRLVGAQRPLSTPPMSTTASVKASARQEGVTAVVDGKLMGALPLELKGLSPGPHSIEFEGGDRYASQMTTMTLAPGEVKELEPVSLVVTNGAATFDVKTPGASLSLVAADERRELVDYSHPIDIDNTKSWVLEASKRGHKTVRFPVTFEDQAEKTFVIALEEEQGEPSLRVATRADPASPAVQPDIPPAAAVKRHKTAEPSGENRAEPVETGNCTLSINSVPASHLTLDGRSVGTTPKTGISVPAGTHSVMFVSDRGKKATIVTCKSGEQKTMSVQLGR